VSFHPDSFTPEVPLSSTSGQTQAFSFKDLDYLLAPYQLVTD
jgi:hypothetical protein